MKTMERNIQIDGQEYPLTRMEYELYQWMRLHRGTIVSRGALLRNVWGFPMEADTRSVDMCIRRLRAKLGPDVIQTIYGKGYLMTA